MSCSCVMIPESYLVTIFQDSVLHFGSLGHRLYNSAGLTFLLFIYPKKQPFVLLADFASTSLTFKLFMK